MDYQSVNLKEKLALFSKHWSPKIVAQMNDYHFKLAKVQGEFVWHDHPETDEVFIVVSGQLEIQFRDGNVILKEGELFVVPKGMEHKPSAESECHILLVEPAGTINTGDVVDEKTAPKQCLDLGIMNRVKLLFFATLRDRAGTRSMELDVPEDLTIQGLKEKISAEYPNLRESMLSVLITINREYAFDEAVIPPNAELAMFPPVSGG